LADFLERLYNLESVSFNGKRLFHDKSVEVAARVIIGHPMYVDALVKLLVTFHGTISLKVDWRLVMNLRIAYKKRMVSECFAFSKSKSPRGDATYSTATIVFCGAPLAET
jgi:hypothetical protein